MGLKWELVFAGYYGPVIPVLIGFSLAFPLGALILYVFLRFKQKRRLEPKPKKKKRGKNLPGYMRPIEVDEEGSETEGGVDDEYSRLLRMFGLTDAATEAEIKSVYRKMMKQLHPDRKSDEPFIDDENSERFRELKYAYDRILEIRASWFKGRRR